MAIQPTQTLRKPSVDRSGLLPRIKSEDRPAPRNDEKSHSRRVRGRGYRSPLSYRTCEDPVAVGGGRSGATIGTMAAHIVLPSTHRVFANLKRWALGVYHGLRRQHLQSYLDEFVFRFNRRHTRHAAFRSLLGIATTHGPFTYNMLIKPDATG